MFEQLDLLIGAAFVLVAAADRFNTPPTNRSSTTALRYHLAALGYMAVGLTLFFSILAFPQALNIAPAIGTVGPSLPPWAERLSTPLLVALLLTVLLPKIPLLGDGDDWIRKQLQKMGAIPYEARRMSAELRRSEFRIPLSRQAEIKKHLANEGFSSLDVVFEESSTPQYVWTKISALMVQLEEWESDRKFIGFVARFAAEYDDLKKSYRQLSPRAKTCFRLMRDLSIDASDSRGNEMALQYQADFAEQCTDLLNKICDFISRGLLQCGPTYGARVTRLAALGFNVHLVRPRLTLNQLMLLFGVVGIVMLSGFVIVPGGANARFEELLARSAMISTIYVVAVLCAVYPKEKWRFAHRDPKDVRPVAFYFAAGTMAGLVAPIVSFTFHLLIFRDFSVAVARFPVSCRWSAVAFVAAFMTALLIDDQPTAKVPRSRLRWIEGGVLAASLMVAGLLVRLWISQIATIDPSTAVRVPPLAGVLLLGATAGFVIGSCVPTWYREAPREKVQDLGFVDQSQAPAGLNP